MAAEKGNKYAIGNNGGRPPIYDDPIILHDKCIEYFESCIETPEKATITGLALFLGFCSRGTLNEYAKKDKFSDIIKRAMLTVENSYETSGNTFDIFALKNMGWKDKTEVEATNTNLNTDLDDKEREEAIKRVKKGLNEFEDYE